MAFKGRSLRGGPQPNLQRAKEAMQGMIDRYDKEAGRPKTEIRLSKRARKRQRAESSEDEGDEDAFGNTSTSAGNKQVGKVQPQEVVVKRSSQITVTLTRKERRKEERKLKKARRSAFQQSTELPTLEGKILHKQTQLREAAARKEKFAEKKAKRQAKAEAKVQALKDAEEAKALFAAANREDEIAINQMERKLHIKQKKKRLAKKIKGGRAVAADSCLPQTFYDEGLGYILDSVDSAKLRSADAVNMFGADSDLDGSSSEDDEEEGHDNDGETSPKQKKAKRRLSEGDNSESDVSEYSDSDSDTEADDLDEEDSSSVELGSGSGAEKSDGDDVEDDADDGDSDNDDEEEDDPIDNGDEAEEGLEDDVDGDEPSTELKEDIYGRLRDKDNNIVTKPGSYIPPGKRAAIEAEGSSSAQATKLGRQLKGLLNRLSEANMERIGSEVGSLYDSSSRALVSEKLIELVEAACLSREKTPAKLAAETAMFVALLHNNQGSEIGATFVQRVATTLHSLHFSKSPPTDSRAENRLVFLSHLLNFQVIGARLIFDLLKLLLDRFTEQDITLILVILRTCGFILRKEDSVSMKNVLLRANEKARSSNTHDSSRVSFMLEILTAIKNNNIRKIPNYDAEGQERAKKQLRAVIKSSSSLSTNRLNVPLDDILSSATRGKWWLVGSAWSGRQDGITGKGSKSAEVSMGDGKITDKVYSVKILELARTQGMNTDARKAIFCVLMTSEDYVDAFNGLMHLRLKAGQQERETVGVAVHCCTQEKEYNPYYGALCNKLLLASRKYQMAYQFLLWDKFSAIDSLSEDSVINLAKLTKHLILNKSSSLALLKTVVFSSLTKSMVRFLRVLLEGIATDANSPDLLSEVVSKITEGKPELQLLRDSLKLFIGHFFTHRKKTSESLRTQMSEFVRLLSAADFGLS